MQSYHLVYINPPFLLLFFLFNFYIVIIFTSLIALQMSTFAAVTEFLEPVVVIRRRRREGNRDIFCFLLLIGYLQMNLTTLCAQLFLSQTWTISVMPYPMVGYLVLNNYCLLISIIGAISMEQFLEEAEGSLSGVRSNGLLENNILVTHFLAGYKHNVDEDVVTPLYVHSTSDAFVGPSPLSCDIDSFAYVGDHVPYRAPFGLVFRPRYELSYKSNREVTWAHPKYTGNVEVGINRVRKVHFLKNDKMNVSYTYTGNFYGA